MKSCLIFVVLVIAILGPICSNRTESISHETELAEKQQLQRKAEADKISEARRKELPKELRILAQKKGADKLAVAREIVERVPLLHADIEGPSYVQIVKRVNVSVPNYKPPVPHRGVIRPEARDRQRKEFRQRVEEIKVMAREAAVKASEAQLILTTLAPHDITLKVRLMSGDEVVEEGEFRPEEIREYMKRRSIQPGDPLSLIRAQELYHPLSSSWPTPPKFISP